MNLFLMGIWPESYRKCTK